MFVDSVSIFTPFIIILLIIWLIYRIKNSIKLTIRNEIYKNFPTIKDVMDTFERRIDNLKSEVEVLENRVKQLRRESV